MLRTYKFSEEFERQWRQLAQKKSPARLSREVIQLSDHFIKEQQLKTPWHMKDLSSAYEIYFHPLNYLRCKRAIHQAQNQNFFDGLTHILDWGSGLGAFTLALLDELPAHLTRKLTLIAVDESPLALKQLKEWDSSGRVQTALTGEFHKLKLPWQSTGVALSYSLNEMPELPLLGSSPEAFFLIEPSTHKLARRLQAVRAQLLELGYQAYAPCPHQDSCPLLKGDKDWCHDRLHWEPPQLWNELFKDLPIKNFTLTHSYLAAKREAKSITLGPGWIRVVSDELEEKGRTRWWICAGPKIASLAWLSRWGEAPSWKRGDLHQVPQELWKKLHAGGEHKLSPEQLLSE